jgi:F-type H+-transporting ATPase subunit b
MPQIEQIAATYASQIFWLLLIFGLVFFIVGKGMVPKVMSTIDLRDKRISDDLDAADAARAQADREEEAWRKRENDNRAQAQALLSGAKADAGARTEKHLAAAQARIDERMAEAEARIEAARNSAANQIEDVAAEATQNIVLRIAALNITGFEARHAVKEAMTHG